MNCDICQFYHIKNLQSTKTIIFVKLFRRQFYHIKNLQSTKTAAFKSSSRIGFYHIKNLQSTKTGYILAYVYRSFITLRIYKVLKLFPSSFLSFRVLSH